VHLTERLPHADRLVAAAPSAAAGEKRDDEKRTNSDEEDRPAESQASRSERRPCLSGEQHAFVLPPRVSSKTQCEETFIPGVDESSIYEKAESQQIELAG
jgi:hypothetical protein